MIALNQTYRINQTLQEYPDLVKIRNDYWSWLEKTSSFFTVDFQNYGRYYDVILALHRLNFRDMVVCELGARGSFHPCYLTKYVNKIRVSDSFEGWGDFGNQKVWEAKWMNHAIKPDRLCVETVDMCKTPYKDDAFDIVLSFSAIEHVQDDIAAIKEMARICKPNGCIAISTEMSDVYRSFGTNHFYDEKALFDRLINPSGCKLLGDYDFSFTGENIDTYPGQDWKFMSCFFILQKGATG
jgi:SAM-dependent methyltransferase